MARRVHGVVELAAVREMVPDFFLTFAQVLEVNYKNCLNFQAIFHRIIFFYRIAVTELTVGCSETYK